MTSRLVTILSVAFLLSTISSCDAQEKGKAQAAKFLAPPGDSAAQHKPQQPQVNESANLKIYVDGAGKITADGQPVSFDELDASLKQLKVKNGIVYYSRANAADRPTDQAMQVIELVVSNAVPIRLYTDGTFKQPVVIEQ